jgi:hypothetical protein
LNLPFATQQLVKPDEFDLAAKCQVREVENESFFCWIISEYHFILENGMMLRILLLDISLG